MIRRECIPTSAIPIPSCVILACCRRLLGDTDEADCTDSFRYRSKSIVDERRGSMALNDKKIVFHVQLGLGKSRREGKKTGVFFDLWAHLHQKRLEKKVDQFKRCAIALTLLSVRLTSIFAI